MKSHRNGPGIPVETHQVLSKHGVGRQQYMGWALHQVQRRARLAGLVVGLALTGLLGVVSLAAALSSPAAAAAHIPTWKRIVLAMLLGPGLGLLITVIAQVQLSRPPDPERTEGQMVWLGLSAWLKPARVASFSPATWDQIRNYVPSRARPAHGARSAPPTDSKTQARAARLRSMERVTLWLSFVPLLLTCLVPKAWIGLPAGAWLVLGGTWAGLMGAREFITGRAIVNLEPVRGPQAQLLGLVELAFGAGATLLGLAGLAMTLAKAAHFL